MVMVSRIDYKDYRSKRYSAPKYDTLDLEKKRSARLRIIRLGMLVNKQIPETLPHKGIVYKLAILTNPHVIKPDFAATFFRSLIQYQIPMNDALIAVVSVLVTFTRREV
jgi:hypothetical protein